MTGETTLLRPLEPADKDFLARMAYEALCGSFKEIPPFGEEAAMRAVAANAEDWGRNGDAGLVAEHPGGEAAGAAWYRLFPDRFTILGEGRTFTPVVTMAVQPEARGRGLGRALLEGLMDHAAAGGIRRLNLSVALHNTVARQLYESVGFTEVKRYLAYFDPDFVPAMKMTAQTARPDK